VPEGYQVQVPLNDEGNEVAGSLSLPRPVTRADLDSFQAVELLTTNVLNYQIDLPDVPPPPLATRVPQPESTDAVQPADGTPTTVTIPGSVDCAPFRPTSPLDGAAYGQNTFYWDPAPGATSYRVTVEGGPSGSTSSGTNLSLDLSSMGLNPQITWYVEALQNDVVACRSQNVTIPREWEPTPIPSISLSVSCADTFTYRINYSGVPSGTTSLVVNYAASNSEVVSPGSPITISNPGESGSITLNSDTGVEVSRVSAVANPSGVSATANGPYSC
jgi:hypothetical protein